MKAIPAPTRSKREPPIRKATRLSAVPAPIVPTKELTAFGALLKRLREERGISQAKLARNCGVSPGYIGLIETGERGQRPGLEFIRRLSAALHVGEEEADELWRTAGHLKDDEAMVSPGCSSVPEAIAADKRLTVSQKALFTAWYYEMVPL
jgi:transcriptional regulator with XRE-family HTH domain